MNHRSVLNGGIDPSSEHGKRVRFVICAILIAVTFGIYYQVSRFEFVNFDDPAYVYENDVVQQGVTLPGIVWAFARSHAANWHPLTWISHMVDCQLFGLDAGGHHITNLVLHTLAGTLLFLFLSGVTGAIWRSAFVAALFLWHPMHVESVAWVSERKDVLSAFFFVLTLMAYARYVKLKSDSSTGRLTDAGKFYGITLILYAFGLLAKSMLVTIPFVLLLLDVWPLSRFNSKADSVKLVREKIPFLGLAAVLSVITFIAQKNGGSVTALDRLALQDRVGNALISYVRYIQKLFWPSGLSSYYLFPKPIPWNFVILSIALLLILTALVLAVRRKLPWTFTGWFWFVGMLLPVIGVVQVGRQGMADRYSYLPSIGLFIAVTWTVWEFAQKLGNKKAIVGAAAIVVSACMAVAAHRQTGYWQNSGTLAQHAIDVEPGNAYEHQNLGMYWFRHNRPDLAVQQLREADRLQSGDPSILNSLGWVLMAQGQTAEAQEKFRKVLKTDPNNAQALCTLGTIEVADGNVNEGIKLMRKSVAARPDHSEYRYGLAHALVIADQLSDALGEYRTLLDHDPAFVPALKDMAWLLATCPRAEIRNGAEAVALAERACQITHSADPQCLNVLDVAYAEAGRFSEAIAVADQERQLYLQAGNSNAGAMAEQRIALYRQSKPFHTPGK